MSIHVVAIILSVTLAALGESVVLLQKHADMMDSHVGSCSCIDLRKLENLYMFCNWKRSMGGILCWAGFLFLWVLGWTCVRSFDVYWCRIMQLLMPIHLVFWFILLNCCCWFKSMLSIQIGRNNEMNPNQYYLLARKILQLRTLLIVNKRYVIVSCGGRVFISVVNIFHHGLRGR